MRQEEPTITKEQFRALLIAKVRDDAAEAIKDGWAAVLTDEALSKTVLEEMIASSENLPESTVQLLLSLLLIFEMRRLQDMAQSKMR